ncbi:MAG: type IV pilus twitching motility protein PilT [Acidobacteria bacterium]|nr:type IV pilus twitching motility protein PilT [Acidobacteriota bacterium]
MELDDLLHRAVKLGASDLHLKAGSSPFVRISGNLTLMAATSRLSHEETNRLANQILSNQQKKLLKQRSELDTAYQVPELGRFRANVFRQRGTISLVFRVIPQMVSSLAQLNLPPVLETLCQENRGLILVTGTTGSGKSTALASMVDCMNETRVLHILTIEDPIEYLHRDKKSFVSQREIHKDADSFAGALRAALRQDPDVIMVGEIRDVETVETAMHAAETGHLVLSTLHTLDATETVNRIIALFPPHQHAQIRIQLASVLKAIISLRLIRGVSGERLPASEVLINTEFIKNCIVEPDRTKDIRNALVLGTTQYGTQTFDQSILGFYNQDRITLQEAMAYATNPEELKLRIRGIVSSSEAIDVG